MTGVWAEDDGGPPREYAEGGLELPAAGEILEATVCFDDGVGRCDFHMSIHVANCGDHLRFELPKVPYCNGAGAGLAYCAGPAPEGVLSSSSSAAAGWTWTQSFSGIEISSDGAEATMTSNNGCCYRPAVAGPPMQSDGDSSIEFTLTADPAAS